MMLSEAFGLPDHDRVPTEIASRFDTPEKADAYAADIVEWCRWASLLPAERGEAAREWWLRGQVNQAEAALDRFMASMKRRRTAGVADWLKGQRTVAKAVRAQWMELTRHERREHITLVRQGDGVSLNFGERRNLVVNAMLRHWSGIPPKERTSYITAVVRGAWSALGTDERIATEAQWLDGLTGYAGNCLWFAWRWHSEPETDATVRPSLLTATACVLALVAGWDANGRPVPARAIREILGLPKYNDLPAFLAAARRDADAARSGKTMTDQELAALVNVTAMSIRKWRPDFGRFSDSVSDNFFPLGLPAFANGSVAVATRPVEGTLTTVAETVSAKRAAALSAIDNHGRTDQHKRRRPNTASMSVEPRVALLKAALHIMITGSTVPTELPIALAHVLGMVSPVTGRILVGSDTLGAVGLPDVDDPEKFRNAARLEGEWLRKRIEQMQPDESRITFKKAWERAANDIETSEVLQQWFADKVHDCLDEGWLAVGADAVAREVGSGRKGRSTVADWKKKQEYRRLVHDAAIWPVVNDFAWRRWRGTRATLPSN